MMLTGASGHAGIGHHRKALAWRYVQNVELEVNVPGLKHLRAYGPRVVS